MIDLKTRLEDRVDNKIIYLIFTTLVIQMRSIKSLISIKHIFQIISDLFLKD